MRYSILTLIFLLFFSFSKSQTLDVLTVKHIDSDKRIKNVNIIIPQLDTVLVTDTAGVVNLSGIQKIDTFIVKKFGYKKQIVTNNQGLIQLEKDTLRYSHNLKLLDLKHKDGFSFVELSINGEIFWFKQKGGSLYLGNGIEIETSNDYENIFKNHEIIKTVHIDAFNCLNEINIRGENYANFINVIYYKPEIKKKASKRIPSMSWYSKRKMRRDLKILKLENGCLND